MEMLIGIMGGFLLLLLLAIIPAMVFQFRFRWIMCKTAGVLLVVVIIGAFFLPKNNPSGQATAAIQPTQAKQSPIIKPKETKQQYLASTRKIGNDKSPIFWKEFLKNPSKFKDQRVNVVGEIFQIEESAEGTILQVYISRNFDSVIAVYQGSIPFYKDDKVIIYGEGAGKVEGQNAMGVAMEWPVITARYIEKHGEN